MVIRLWKEPYKGGECASEPYRGADAQNFLSNGMDILRMTISIPEPQQFVPPTAPDNAQIVPHEQVLNYSSRILKLPQRKIFEQ
jgi:hypothetical protein